ncbi:hypothetical protein RRG08_013421 [Elysia crispata]|uniref:Uncharacterized protein n=1 Tax=Elysia crispata TaxID=231223 RepID=A0AAE0ZP59_9GAST|nr:hypothetical protein RRG08_013421 [Elysia crispata]
MPVEKIRGGGELFKHHWTTFSKVQQAPLKFYWTHGRMFRYYVYSAAIMFPLFMYLTKASYAPANVKQWEQIRASRRHTFFDLPH